MRMKRVTSAYLRSSDRLPGSAAGRGGRQALLRPHEVVRQRLDQQVLATQIAPQRRLSRHALRQAFLPTDINYSFRHNGRRSWKAFLRLGSCKESHKRITEEYV